MLPDRIVRGARLDLCSDAKERAVAGSEPVTSPDQHKPINRKAARIGAILTIIAIVAMAAFGNHEGRVEEVFSYGIAALLALVLIVDAVLHRAGLRD